MGRCRHRLGFLVVLLAVSISVMPLLTPVSAEVSADGWAPQESGTLLTLYGVSGTPPSDVLACGDAGVILRYNGSAWVSMNSGITVPLYGIWSAPTGEVYAIGNAGTIVRHNGVSWSQMASGTSNHLNAVWGTAVNDVFAVGNVGAILHYDGTSWSQMASGTTSHLRGIWGSSPNDVFAAGNGGIILHYDGISWTSMVSSTRAKLYAIWGSAADNVLAVGEDGTIVRYDGVSWSGVSGGTTASLNGIWGTAADDIFVVGANGLILHYDGVWSPMSSGTGSTLDGIWGASSSNVYAVGAGGTILHYNDSPPAVTSVQPGQACQGETLTAAISGSNFNGTTLVDFGAGVTVTSFQVNVTGTQITADIAIDAAAALGSRDVSVTTPAGSDTLSSAFTVQLPPPVPPVLTAVTPVSGVCGQALVAVISGSNLNGTTLVDFGAAVTVTGFQVNAEGTQITADVAIDAAAAPGTRDVSVATPAGTDTLASAFTVQLPPPVPPALTSIAPVSGFCGQALPVTIYGTNLNGTSVVDFGAGVSVTSFQISPDGTQITADITIDAAAAPGTRDVSVTTPAGTDALSSSFTVQLPPTVPPIVTSVTPSSGVCGQALVAVISGSNLSGATVVDFGAGVSVTSFQVSPDGTQITADITIDAAAAPGTRNVSVTTPSGTDTLAGAFTVQLPPPVPPVLTGVAPGSGVSGQAIVAVISGSNLGGATVVDFGMSLTVTGFQVNPDGTQITANITIDGAAIPGTRNVSVTTPAGTDTLGGAFTVQSPPPTPPVLNSVAPGSGVSGQAMAVVIKGTDLNGATIVDFGDGVIVTGFQVNPDGTQITADIAIDAAAAPGTRDISVTTAAGSAVFDGAFTVLIPFSYVVEVSPKSAMIGETIDMVISGEKLENVIAVDFGPGIEVNSFTLESADRMSVRITIRQDAKAGYRDVSIVTLWSTYTQLEGFAVKAVPPSLGSISDVDGRPGEVMTVTIEGANLVGVTRVSFGPDIEVQGFDMYPPDSLRVRISVAEDAEPGMRDVSVTTAPGGTCIFEDAFEITSPATNTPPWVPIGAATGALMAGTLLLVFRGVSTLRGLRSS